MLVSLFLLFIIISFINIAGEFTPFKKKIRLITTPLIIPSLALYIFTSREDIYPLLLIAFVCGWIGSIILMIRDKKERCNFYLYGLIFFTISHIFYIIAFSSKLINQWRAMEPLSLIIAGLIFISGLIHLIRTKKIAGKIFFAVAAYTLILTALCCISILSFYPHFFLSSIFGIVGTVFLIVSDVVLSSHQLKNPITMERPIAMGTFIVAHFAIAISLTGTYPHPWW